MTVRRRIQTTEVGGVNVVSFIDRKILEAPSIQELGEELFSLVEQDGYRSMLLDFSNVEFLSSAALNKLIILDKKVKDRGGELKLCNLQPEIREVFVITRLNQLFDIKTTKDEALQAF
jgi:anti-sigma B factor antagonist